jgi:hypothetical protein
MASDVTQQDQVQQTEILMRKSCIKPAELVRRQTDDSWLKARFSRGWNLVDFMTYLIGHP